MANASGKIRVFDIHTATYLELKNTLPELTMQGTRVVFEFEPLEAVHELLREYQSHRLVPILDYVNILRCLTARMLSMKGQQ